MACSDCSWQSASFSTCLPGCSLHKGQEWRKAIVKSKLLTLSVQTNFHPPGITGTEACAMQSLLGSFLSFKSETTFSQKLLQKSVKTCSLTRPAFLQRGSHVGRNHMKREFFTLGLGPPPHNARWTPQPHMEGNPQWLQNSPASACYQAGSKCWPFPDPLTLTQAAPLHLL